MFFRDSDVHEKIKFLVSLSNGERFEYGYRQKKIKRCRGGKKASTGIKSVHEEVSFDMSSTESG